MARTVALAFVLFVITVGEAQATAFRVVIVPSLGLDDIPTLAERGAVGLLVPGTGPKTSGAAARAALVRGRMTNWLRGLTTGPRLIDFETAGSIPVGPAIVVGLPGATQPNDRRFPVAVIGGGYRGILTSDSTRIPGLVSIVDIAPTALGRDNALGWKSDGNAAADLGALESRMVSNNRTRVPATVLVVVLTALLALAWPRAALLGLAAALAANLALGLAGISAAWAVLTVLALAILLGGPLLALLLSSELAVGSALATVLVAYLVALGADGSGVALSTFGPAPNGRFYGVPNLLETMLLVPALAGAALLGRRLGPIAFALVALASFVAVAGNRFGADGGGAIVLAVGFALLAALLWKARGRVLVAALVGGVALALGLIALDAATGASSHVTRALGSGPGGLAGDLRDRLTSSWNRIAHKPSVTVVVAIGVVLLVILTVHVLRLDRPLSERALPLAFAGAVAVSLLVNDSPNDVVLAGSVGLVVCERVMLRGRCAAASCSRSPSALSSPAAAARRLSRLRPRP